MNVPLGTLQIEGKELSSDSIIADLREFMDANKSGYFCITTQGEFSIEEGLLVIEGGVVIAAHYEYMRAGKEYFAGEALKRVLNCFFSNKGIYDVYTTTSQQLELLKIFNENMLLLEGIRLTSLEGMIPISFSQEYERQVYTQPIEPEREEVLKKHGLTEMRIDNYEEIKREVERMVPEPKSTKRVEDEVESYLTGTPLRGEEPKEKPKIEMVEFAAKPKEKLPEEKKFEEALTDLDKEAEKLKKFLEKK